MTGSWGERIALLGLGVVAAGSLFLQRFVTQEGSFGELAKANSLAKFKAQLALLEASLPNSLPLDAVFIVSLFTLCVALQLMVRSRYGGWAIVVAAAMLVVDSAEDLLLLNPDRSAVATLWIFWLQKPKVALFMLDLAGIVYGLAVAARLIK